jgi:hypothetical protein
MNAWTRAVTALLRRMVLLLPRERRDWVEAVWAEADDVPAGRRRASWLLGGVWVLVRQARPLRLLAYAFGLAAFVVADVGVAGGPGQGSSTVVTGTAFALMLAVLPFLGRWYPPWGPVANNRPARLVRAGGYLAICALVLLAHGIARIGGTRFSDADLREMLAGHIVGAVINFAILGGYVAAVLALTSRRSAIAPRTLTVGAGAGVAIGLFVYGLTPFGHRLPLAGPTLSTLYMLALFAIPVTLTVVTGVVAARGVPVADLPTADHGPQVRQGLAAGVCAGGTAALTGAILTMATILRWPDRVPLMWANPDANVPHGTPYELAMSISDSAARYVPILFFAPLLGLVLGALGGAGIRPDRLVQPTPRAGLARRLLSR